MDIKKLKEELLREYRFQTELHAHTSPASSCSQIVPEKLAKIYKDLGYSAVCVVNHFVYEYQGLSKKELIDRYFGDFERAEKRGKEIGIKVILGAEIRFNENDNDYLIYGVTRDMLEEIYNLLPYGVDNFRKVYKMPDSVFLQAHPFREGMERVDPAILDGIEVYNVHPNHNSKIGLAAVYAKEQGFSIITSGSDFHHPDRKHEGVSAIRTKVLPEDSFHLASILRSGDYLMEIGRNNIIIP
ncbi:MAG: PHP domain-containing protein [Clostridia bacterium]|nr:PHP domain-containing protein [Clostridia bacterium]